MCFLSDHGSFTTCTQRTWTALLMLLSLSSSAHSAPLSAPLQAFSFQREWSLPKHAHCPTTLCLWVSLPFPMCFEPPGQSQLQLKEGQRSSGCSGSCQSCVHKQAAGSQSKRDTCCHSQESLEKDFQKRLKWWRDLAAIFTVAQAPRRLNSCDPFLAPVDKSVWKQAASLSEMIDACRNADFLYCWTEHFVLSPLMNPPPFTTLCFISLG